MASLRRPTVCARCAAPFSASDDRRRGASSTLGVGVGSVSLDDLGLGGLSLDGLGSTASGGVGLDGLGLDLGGSTSAVSVSGVVTGTSSVCSSLTARSA